MSEKTAFDAMMDSAQSDSAPQAPAPDAAPGGRPRDETGRFATKAEDAPVAPQAAAPTPAPASTPAPEPIKETIPLATALDWRDDLRATKRELADLKKRIDSTPAPQAPSAIEQPEEFARYMADLTNSTRVNTLFEVSETMAREKHGEDTVTKAMDWAMQQSQGSPAFAAEYLKQKHPIDWAVKQQKRYALLDVMGDDPDAYIASEIAKRTAAGTPSEPQPAGAAPQQPAAPQAPRAPRSIASTPSAGSQHSVPVGPGNAFEAAIP